MASSKVFLLKLQRIKGYKEGDNCQRVTIINESLNSDNFYS